MKQNYVLIDYENVQPAMAAALADPVFKVYLFMGVQQHKVPVELVTFMHRKGTDAVYVPMKSSGRNALDFHMAWTLGQLCERDPDGYFHLITQDTGLDPLLHLLREQKFQAHRWADVQDIPIVKASGDLSDDQRLSRIIEYLWRRGPQRPASIKTLRTSAAALFHPTLDPAQTTGLLDQLQLHGVFALDGSRLVYGFPDEPDR